VGVGTNQSHFASRKRLAKISEYRVDSGKCFVKPDSHCDLI